MSKKLPEGWKEYKLGKLFDIKKGKKIIQLDKNTEDSIRCIQIEDLRNNDFIKYCDNDPKYLMAIESDILIAWDGANAGTIGYGISGAVGSTLAILRCKEDKILTPYVARFLQGKFDYLRATCTGATIPHISRQALEGLSIPIPPLEEQERIVSILDRAEGAICKREECNRLLDELIQSKFIDMFGNPSINSKKWKVEELSNVLVNIENGKSFVCENYNREGSHPAILKLSAVTYGIYNPLENKALIDKEAFIENVEVKKGDLLFTRKNTPELVGMSAYVYETTPNLMMPDLIFRLNTNEKCNKIYLWQLINNKLFRGKIKALSNGSAKSMSNISKQNLMRLEIPIPPIEVQDEFADFVSQVNKLKVEMKESLEELQNNFNSLMQRAFKGEL